MVDEKYRDYLASPAWGKRRQSALEYADHRCQLCNRTLDLHVHHRTYERFGNERPADLTVLCGACHNAFHRWNKQVLRLSLTDYEARGKRRNCIVCGREFTLKTPNAKTCSKECRKVRVSALNREIRKKKAV